MFGSEQDIDIDQGDVVSLAEGVHWEAKSTRLYDQWLNADVPVNLAAAVVVAQIALLPCRVSELSTALACRYKLDGDDASRDLNTLLMQLDSSALLLIRRPFRSRLLIAPAVGTLLKLLKLDPPRQPARRYPATLAGIGRACIRQSWKVLLIVLLFAAMSTVYLGLAVPPDQRTIALGMFAAIAFSTTLFVFLTAIHEYGHAVALRATGCHTLLVAQRGTRIGIIYPLGSSSSPRVVAAMGPVLAMIVALAIAGVGILWRLPYGWLLPIALPVGLLHLVSLLPWASDGRILWRGPSVPIENT